MVLYSWLGWRPHGGNADLVQLLLPLQECLNKLVYFAVGHQKKEKTTRGSR